VDKDPDPQKKKWSFSNLINMWVPHGEEGKKKKKTRTVS